MLTIAGLLVNEDVGPVDSVLWLMALVIVVLAVLSVAIVVTRRRLSVDDSNAVAEIVVAIWLEFQSVADKTIGEAEIRAVAQAAWERFVVVSQHYTREDWEALVLRVWKMAMEPAEPTRVVVRGMG